MAEIAEKKVEGKKKKKAIKMKPLKLVALIAVALVLLGSVSLVLVEKFQPEQTLIPKALVSLPSKVVSFVMKPFQTTFTWIANGVYDYLESWKLRKNIEIEYNALRAQNEELAYQVQQLEQLQEELGAFQTTWKLAREQYMDKTPILASVIAKESGNWFQKFTIDVGKKHNVQVNMAVVNDKGLIGYIDKVSETTSEVLTIIDSRAGVAGSIRSTGDQGMVHGTLGIDEEPTCRMYYLPVDLVPRPGDVVETSGIGMPFPKGIPIGEVRESTLFMDQNKHYVVVEPMVDFQHIQKVVVLLYLPTQEEIPQGNDGQISYAGSDLDTARPVPTFGTSIEDPYLGSITPPPRVTRAPVEEGELGEDELPADLDDLEAMLGVPSGLPEPDPDLQALVNQEMMDNLLDGRDD